HVRALGRRLDGRGGQAGDLRGPRHRGAGEERRGMALRYRPRLGRHDGAAPGGRLAPPTAGAMRPRFAVVLPQRSFAEARQWAERAEATGYDTVALEDHFFMRSPMETPEDPRLDCFTALAAIAMATRRVRLSQLVACNAFRHPALTAKIATTTDHVSGA